MTGSLEGRLQVSGGLESTGDWGSGGISDWGGAQVTGGLEGTGD